MNIRFARLVLLAGCVGVIVMPACTDSQTAPSPTPSSLIVSCAASALGAIGQTAQCQARLTLSDATTQDQTAAAQWSSSDSSKVTVSASGLIAAVAPGTADIIAVVQGLMGRQPVTVNLHAAPTAPSRMRALALTLTQGEQLSGPWAGIVTAPDGYSCKLHQSDAEVLCPPVVVADGTTVDLLVTLTPELADLGFPVRRATGCDALIRSDTVKNGSICRVLMNADKSITISIGWSVAPVG